jgi:acetyl-CoA carboxylase carboxyl transferase subunit beta
VKAKERIAQLTRSFEEQDANVVGRDPLSFASYGDQLARARSEAGTDEACVWGFADIDGARCALVVFDFSFLGGSMGMAVGEKVARAFDAARRRRLPIVTVTASGGARMQEGMWSLVQMARTVEAQGWHAQAGLAHIALLTSPTTGGVYASFASLADVIYAEEGATVGFAGPRVVEELTGAKPAADLHTVETAERHGLVDAVITRADQTRVLGAALRALDGQAREPLAGPSRTAAAQETAGISAWDRLGLVRAPERPKGPVIADALLADAITLRGDRTGASDDEHVLVRIGQLRGTDRNVVAIAQDASGDGRIRPAGFRKAVRAIDLAGRLGLPVVTVIDTRGADPLAGSETAGVAAAIARTFRAMLACPTPTLTLLTGEGGSGGALAMAVADRVVAFSNAVFSVIAPEGAAVILYRDPSRAHELADRMRITVPDLIDLGLVDVVVPEPAGGVQANTRVALDDLGATAAEEMNRLVATRHRRRTMHRHRRWREIGAP